MSAFGQAIVDMFADANVACDALYKQGGNSAGVTVRLVFWDADEQEPFGETHAIIRNARGDVQLSEVASPAKGDTFEIVLPIAGAVTYRVKANPKFDRSAGTARLEMSPA